MATVLTFSSQVVCGHIGNSITNFVLQRMGHNVFNIPSTVLSHHAGHSEFTSFSLDPSFINDIIEMIFRNNQLEDIDAIVTGYMPSEEHVIVAHEFINRILAANKKAIVLCDPIMGDYPNGLYVKEGIAKKIKSLLVPKAHIITPNYFEFCWLSDEEAVSHTRCYDIVKGYSNDSVLITSFQQMDTHFLDNLLFSRDEAIYTRVQKHSYVPKGTGDLFAALFFAHKLDGLSNAQALSFSTSSVETILEQSLKSDYLKIVEGQDLFAQAKAWEIKEII